MGETLFAQVALEWPLSTVDPQVHFEVGQLTEGLETDVAFILDFAVLLLERVWERLVPRCRWRGRG